MRACVYIEVRFANTDMIKDPRTKEFCENGDTFNGWIGPDVHFLFSTIKNGSDCCWVLTHKDEHDIDESWSFPGKLEEVYEVLEGWDPICKAIVEKTPSLVDWKLVYRDPLPTWVSKKRRILLLGDSAHPFLPTSAQGATQAMEDGTTLAICLRRAGKDNVQAALKTHEEIRYAPSVPRSLEPHFLLMGYTDTTVSRPCRRLARPLETCGTRLIGTRSGKTLRALQCLETTGFIFMTQKLMRRRFLMRSSRDTLAQTRTVVRPTLHLLSMLKQSRRSLQPRFRHGYRFTYFLASPNCTANRWDSKLLDKSIAIMIGPMPAQSLYSVTKILCPWKYK